MHLHSHSVSAYSTSWEWVHLQCVRLQYIGVSECTRSVSTYSNIIWGVSAPPVCPPTVTSSGEWMHPHCVDFTWRLSAPTGCHLYLGCECTYVALIIGLFNVLPWVGSVVRGEWGSCWACIPHWRCQSGRRWHLHPNSGGLMNLCPPPHSWKHILCKNYFIPISLPPAIITRTLRAVWLLICFAVVQASWKNVLTSVLTKFIYTVQNHNHAVLTSILTKFIYSTEP